MYVIDRAGHLRLTDFGLSEIGLIDRQTQDRTEMTYDDVIMM